MTNIDDDSKWSSLRLSDVGIDERTITKIVAKINQINLERESTRQFNEIERRFKFLSMITYESRAPGYQSARRTSTSIPQERQHPFVFADRQGLRRAVASRIPQRHDPPPRSTATLWWRPSR
eukprot:2581490-Pleurochrysis_carterae.AAC.2